MPLVISTAASALAYLVLMQLLFEDFDEFRKKFRSMIECMPVSVMVDYSFGRDSLRPWAWMMSGPMIGVVVYSFVAR